MKKRFLYSFLALLSLIVLFFFISSYSAEAKVLCGIDVLKQSNFEILKDKRVGLVTNPSGVDACLNSTIDILYQAEEVNLVALYGPEHGVRGDIYAGDKIEDSIDTKTGLPIYSLYGQYREPSPEMLEGIDVMVYDIQDLGTRSYTFISTLGLVMRACAKKNITVVVLDRPNPLGGNKIEGAYPQEGFYSFVGQYTIPYIYGLTIGELAMLINEKGLNRGQKCNEEFFKCDLHVVKMQGWSRDMLYKDTGLAWVLPSPNIPSIEAALAYPASGILGELYGYMNIGIGYSLPFQLFGAEWLDSYLLLEKLQSYNIPGVSFRPIYYKPFWGSKAGKKLQGLQFFYTDYDKALITLTQFYVMQAVAELYPEQKPFEKNAQRLTMFNKICGSDFISKTFPLTMNVESIYDYWTKDVEAFRELAQEFYLY